MCSDFFITLLIIFSLLAVPSLSAAETTHLLLPTARKLGGDDTLYCESWRYSVDTNDAGDWTTVPTRCADFIQSYMTGGRFSSDSYLVAENALTFAKSVDVAAAGDGMVAWVFDIDETLLTSSPYYQLHGFGTEVFNEDAFDKWVSLAEAPALPASLCLYKELQQLGFTIFILTGRDEPVRNATEANLHNAGYSNWKRLILRGALDQGVSVTDSQRKLESEVFVVQLSTVDRD